MFMGVSNSCRYSSTDGASCRGGTRHSSMAQFEAGVDSWRCLLQPTSAATMDRAASGLGSPSTAACSDVRACCASGCRADASLLRRPHDLGSPAGPWLSWLHAAWTSSQGTVVILHWLTSGMSLSCRPIFIMLMLTSHAVFTSLQVR